MNLRKEREPVLMLVHPFQKNSPRARVAANFEVLWVAEKRGKEKEKKKKKRRKKERKLSQIMYSNLYFIKWLLEHAWNSVRGKCHQFLYRFL